MLPLFKRRASAEPLTEPQLREKAAAWCLQRWRSEAETRRKLREWGADFSLVNRVLDWLLDQQFLDDERFARSFVKDKTGLSGWGRRKVLAALSVQHSIKSEAAQQAIATGLDEHRYTERLLHTVASELRKYNATGPDDLPREHLHGIVRRLAGRGYTSSEIWEAIGRSGPDFDHETAQGLAADTEDA
jgi:regulatory protein